MDANKVKKIPTLPEALIPIVSMIVVVAVGNGIFKLRVEIMLLIAAAIAAVVGMRLGYTFDELMAGASEKIAKSMGSILILLAVGIIIATWIASGTIPMLIYYGLKLINPRLFYATAFILTAIVSTCTGTSWGSAGTIGVVLIIIAENMGIPLPVAAGAIVGAAFFGDKLSPLSDTTVLASLVTGANIYDHIHHMLYTSIPALIASLGIYTFMGLNLDASTLTGGETITVIMENLKELFHFNVILLLIPIAIILIGAILAKPTIPVMLISGGVATLIAIFYQGFSAPDVFTSMVSGFAPGMFSSKGIDPSRIVPELSTLFQRGGFNSMNQTLQMVLIAFSFAGFVSKSGCLDVIIDKILKVVKTRFELVFATFLSNLTVALATGSNFLTILVPGELFGKAYEERGLAKRNLSRTLEDCGSQLVLLIPWAAGGAYMAGTLGVPTLSYFPYSFFTFGSVIMAMVYAATGWGMLTIEQERALNAKKEAKREARKASHHK